MIPVVTFHSIGIEDSAWTQCYLSSPLEHFEVFCKFIKDKKYDTLFLDEWYELQKNNKIGSRKKIVITFDDGYLDNWVYVFPLLKKYGIKITIFVNPEFVDPSLQIRPNLENVWNDKLHESQLQTVGFLNWHEISKMQSSGLVDIQSHSMTHDTYFKSNILIDFFDGSEKYDWLPWIFYKDKKPYYMTENMLGKIPNGYPIFEYDRSLGIRRFLPSDEFVDYCITEFEKYPKNKKYIISKIKRESVNERDIGRFETDDEQRQRYEYELKASKQVIEEKLKKEVRYLCWPGGRYNELSLVMSKHAGYNASTMTKKSEPKSIFTDKSYKRIQRIGMGSKESTSRSFLMKKNNRGLIYCYKEYTGSIFEKFMLRDKRRIFQMIFLHS